MPAALNYPIPEPVARRAFSAWVPADNGCRISTYSVASHGYAQIGWWDKERGRSRMTLAHRAAWVHIHGQIPDDLTVDHRTDCDRRCVNIEHLRVLSNFENGRRNNRWHETDWPLGECANGHSNSELIWRSGHRRCRLCNIEWQRAWRAKNR